MTSGDIGGHACEGGAFKAVKATPCETYVCISKR